MELLSLCGEEFVRNLQDCPPDRLARLLALGPQVLAAAMAPTGSWADAVEEAEFVPDSRGVKRGGVEAASTSSSSGAGDASALAASGGRGDQSLGAVRGGTRRRSKLLKNRLADD